MNADLPIGNWDSVTPEAMRTYSEAKLYHVMDYGAVVRRTDGLEWNQRDAKMNSELIKSLTDVTTRVHQEVAILSSSSAKLEKLTKTLIILTQALIFITLLAAGVEVWKAYRP